MTRRPRLATVVAVSTTAFAALMPLVIGACRGEPARPTKTTTFYVEPVVTPLSLDLAGSPARGASPAKVTIVAVSDFQCPFCGKAEATLAQVLAAYPKDVGVVFLHHPLSFHKDALPAAKASMAAHVQGKFWAFHDALFATRKLDAASLDALAAELGLDMGRFHADRDGAAVADKIRHDEASAMAQGATGTPGFFINGKPLKGAQPFAQFEAAVVEALGEADAELARGTPLADLHRVLAARHAGPSFVATIIDGGPPPAAPPRPRGKRSTERPAPTGPVEVAVDPTDPARGPADAPVEIVLFSDFECPFCSRVGPVLDQIIEAYPKDVRLVFIQNPLPFHKRARLAATAALAAHEQGKFWEYHDRIFANQKALGRQDLERYATELGLDLERFRAALDGDRFADHIARNQALAKKVGAAGTPSSFVGGVLVRGAQPFAAFKKAVDDALARAKADH